MKKLSEIEDAISKLSENEQGEMLDWLEIHLGTQEMVEQVVCLTQCYVIWWEIKNSKNAKRYDEVLREHLDFFEPVAHILLWQGFFVICYQLFDQRQDSKHIQFRIDQVARTDACLADEMRKKVKDYAVLNKIKTIRHKVSAHCGRNHMPQQVVKDNQPVNVIAMFIIPTNSEPHEVELQRFGGEFAKTLLTADGVRSLSHCKSAGLGELFRCESTEEMWSILKPVYDKICLSK